MIYQKDFPGGDVGLLDESFLPDQDRREVPSCMNNLIT